MTNTSDSSTQLIHSSSLIKRMLAGAVPGLLLISLFLAGTGEPDPSWGEYWMLRPLIVVPIAGAMGGAFYYFADQIGRRLGWNKTLIIILSLIVYLIGLWLGSVLGLAGTYWN